MSWRPEEAERYLNGLAPIGWKLGLDRIRLLTTALGMPQHRFASIHVVGTNGKSSVTRMTSALLEAAGLRAGASVSPHEVRWSERTLIGTAEIDPGRFAEAVEQTASAAGAVERSLEEGEAVTQFEVATAASFVALARERVRVAVIEAGLGGRLDATNVIPSRVTVLTSVGLDHTEWLGEGELEIAGEKLAVLRDGSVLVLGEVSDEVGALARETAERRGCSVVVPGALDDAIRVGAPGPHQRRNFALALAAAEEITGGVDPRVAAEVAERFRAPGRIERVADHPPVYLDAAHNPQGMKALAESIPEIAGDLPVFVALAAMADKDAEGMVGALAPAVEAVVCAEPPDGAAASSRPSSRPHSAAELARLCVEAGVRGEAEPDAGRALDRVVELARSGGGVALVAGTHYLLDAARRRFSVKRFG